MMFSMSTLSMLQPALESRSSQPFAPQVGGVGRGKGKGKGTLASRAPGWP